MRFGKSMWWALLMPVALAAEPFTAEDLVNLKRVSDPRTSPDGRYLAFVLRETDRTANKGRTDIWVLELKAKNAQPRRLAVHEGNDSSPHWAPDSRTLYFLSDRNASQQVWRISVAGGEPVQVTRFPLDVGAFKVSPRGDRLALAMEVFPKCENLACTQEKLEEKEKAQASGKIYEKLFVRHWDSWKNGLRSHLFTAAISADGVAGEPRDVTQGFDADVPSKPFGDDHDFDFSPDGARLAFSARVAGREEAWSTNFDVYEAPVDGSAAPRNLTHGNPAWDANPVYLRNGDLAYLAMERPGFEADRFRVMLRDARTAAVRSLTQDWDRSAGALVAAADGRRLYTLADDVGQHALFVVDPERAGQPQKLVATGQVTEIAPVPQGVVFNWASLGAPADLHMLRFNGARAAKPQQLTSVNRELLAERSLGEYEQFSFSGWNDETVHGYVVKPHGFKAGGRYPIAFLVHGGPQVSFQNLWNYRWNAQTYAGRGYAVVMVDFHGSPGYGQGFTDSISQDWGGKPLEDLQKGLAAALQKYTWLDGERTCALGASYGGFMMNWIAGRWPQAFKCLVNHAGIFDQRTMYYSTEELWFPEWEHGGPYFDKPQNHEKFNPAEHVKNWRTPTLVIHGERDYRVPYSQGLATFTALQRRGIESKLLVFPDENHWVLKPANSLLWHETVLDWLDRFLKPAGETAAGAAQRASSAP